MDLSWRLLSTCKKRGYLIALDDFVANDQRDPLIELADILKVDLKRTTIAERAAMIKRYRPWRCRMLAEKVETHEEFRLARNQGFLYFQGYFFRRPEVMTTYEIPANRISYLRMLQAVSRAELNLREIENVLKSEASLCYRLLRYMNSAVFCEIRRWVRLLAAVGGGQQKPNESDLFFLGLLSLMDVILEIPLAAVLDKVSVDQETKAVLLGSINRPRPVYQLMLSGVRCMGANQ
jgi:c-di-GMP-related signal transduction protein